METEVKREIEYGRCHLQILVVVIRKVLRRSGYFLNLGYDEIVRFFLFFKIFFYIIILILIINLKINR